MAGFETSSTTMSNALYEMALNTSIQEKLREEICAELKAHDDKLSYQSVKSMKYLHMVFNGKMSRTFSDIMYKLLMLLLMVVAYIQKH